MNAGAKAQLVEMLQAVADKLRDRPSQLEQEYGAMPIDTRFARSLGALESTCRHASIEINALIETFLKPQRRRGKR